MAVHALPGRVKMTQAGKMCILLDLSVFIYVLVMLFHVLFYNTCLHYWKVVCMYRHVLCVLKICTYRTRLIHALDMSRESEIFLMTLWLLLAASLTNCHEDIRNRPSSWIVVAFLPSLDADVPVQWDKAGGNSFPLSLN